MLSILIPTYDYTCYKLVYDLHDQAERLGIDYEIVVAEDGSRSQVNIIANHKITELSNCRHIIRRQNAGRAAIRNFLIDESHGELIMLCDSDGKVIAPDFLERYVYAARQHDVVCGGIKVPDVCHDPHRQLRWRYEHEYERSHGYVSTEFRSFCFMLTRQVATDVRFDERFVEYGYEDVLFGKHLSDRGFEIFTIDNPMLNQDIETSDVFLSKTECALRTAHRFRTELSDRVSILVVLRRFRMFIPLLALLFLILGPLMRRNLLSANPSLRAFSLYKLCYLSHISLCKD